MPSVPSYLPSALKRYDPLLRIRYSRERGVFVVERKATTRAAMKLLKKPVKYRHDAYGKLIEIKFPEWTDRYIQYRDRYVPELEVKNPGERIIEILCAADPWRHHGHKGKYFLKREAEAEAKAEEREEEKDSQLLADCSGEARDHLKFLSGGSL